MRGSLTDVLPSVAAVLGVRGATDRLGLAERIGAPARVVLVLVDGLGHALLGRLAPHAPLLASVLAGTTGRLDVLTCAFPSTTPTSLVSLGTGVPPGEHGVLGFTLRVPGTDRLLTHITWGADPPPRQWQPVRTWWDRIAAAGVDTRVVLPAAFLGSGLTVSAYGGARAVGVRPREDYAARLLAEVTAGPGLVYGYTSLLDTAAHVHGIASPQWAAAAAQVDALLVRVAAALPPGTALLVTADHGGLDVPAHARVDIATEPDLAAGLRLVTGEPRVRHLHTQPGAAADVHAAWTAVLAGRATVLTRADAVASGLFGPVAPAHLARIGDVVAVAEGDAAVLATGYEPPVVATLVGMHGALTPAEVDVPLVTLTA